MAGGKIIVKLVAPVTYNVTNDVDFIEVDTSSGGLTTINLQKIDPSGVRKTFYISDIGNNASVGNINVVASGGNLINNAGMISLDANGIIAEIVVGNTSKFIANLSTDIATSTNGHIIQDEGVNLPQRQFLNFKGNGVLVTDNGGGNASDVNINLSPIANLVYVAKNGNDLTGDGSIAFPFLTIQKGIDVAYTFQSLAPMTRPCVVVGPGTYTEDCVLKANVFVKGVGINDTRVSGNWTIDNTFTPVGDFRSGFIDIGIFGSFTADFNAVASNEGKIFITNTRITGAITMTAFSSINQFIWFGGEFFDTITLNGMNTQFSSVIDQAANGVILYSNANSDTYFATSGGALSNVLAFATIDRAFELDLSHAIKSVSILAISNTTLNSAIPFVRANAQSIPAPNGMLLLNNTSFDSNIEIVNQVTINTQPPLWLGKKQYYFLEEFDKGVLPSGWATSLSGGTSTYTQAYEQFAIGQVLLSAPRGAAVVRAGLGYGTTYNYILNMLNAVQTIWAALVRRAPTDVGFAQVGLSNLITIVLPASFGNTISVIHDPNNMSGKNPGLLTNWLLVTQKRTTTFSVYDTGVAPDNTWQEFTFKFTNIGGINKLILVVNGVITNTITDMTNMPTSDVAGAGNAMSPIAYVGSLIGAVGANAMRVSKFSLFRQWT